ncbi:MAG TPA: TylF/MycF/NovP-related O-methyltransferase [Terriglobia bacterium]|nr:TylF/MycF/NovP-related O-methyltransferase [Terriglobia bacterium]
MVFGHDSFTRHRAKASEIWNKMRFFAFDSFCGLPDPRGVDRSSADFAEGQYSVTLQDFVNNLKHGKVDLSKVAAIPGWFEDTCKPKTIENHRIRSASIVHIDCDLYESARVVLKFVEPLLLDGTILIFDDWYCFRGNPDLGEQRAFKEWAAGKPDWVFTQYQKEGPARNSFIANHRIG